jgi:adenylate cyclase
MTHDKTPRKLAAIAAADVAGYATLMGADEEGTLSGLKAHRRELIDPKIEEYGGRIVKRMGDGLLLEFPSIVDALWCWLDIQRGMRARNEAIAIARRIQFRVGLNIGDIIIDEGDIYGDGVNIAARLESIADPGGICVSRAVIDQVKQKVDIKFEDLGDRSLKNIEEPVRAYRILDDIRTMASAGSCSPATEKSECALPLPVRPSVAILPFKNLNTDPENEFIADGISLGITNLLVQLSGLFFINACSKPRYRNGELTAAEAVADLPVRYVLEGAVQRSGNRVRATARLADLSINAITWASQYDCELEDVFALQDEVTREVIRSLSSEILGGNFDVVWTERLTGRGAWEYYLRGLSHFYKFTKRDNAIAKQMMEKVHSLHPEEGIAAGYLAMNHWLDAARGWSNSPDESIKEATKWASMSLEADTETDGLAHIILGSVRLLEGKFDDALALCRKGLSSRANCPFALGQTAAVQNYCGDADAAVKTAREALSVRMVYPPPLINVLAIAYRDSGRIDLSLSAAREAARLDSEHTDALVTMCSDYALAGKESETREIAGKIVSIDPEFNIAAYARKQPYRDNSVLARITELLRAAGLPG